MAGKTLMTGDENIKFMEICLAYISLQSLRNMAMRLDEEVGKLSSNDDVRRTTACLRAVTENLVSDSY